MIDNSQTNLHPTQGVSSNILTRPNMHLRRLSADFQICERGLLRATNHNTTNNYATKLGFMENKDDNVNNIQNICNSRRNSNVNINNNIIIKNTHQDFRNVKISYELNSNNYNNIANNNDQVIKNVGTKLDPKKKNNEKNFLRNIFHINNSNDYSLCCEKKNNFLGRLKKLIRNDLSVETILRMVNSHEIIKKILRDKDILEEDTKANYFEKIKQY